MSIRIACAPCCWGVDDPKNPFLPKWERVMEEAHLSGFSGIELGPYGYILLDVKIVTSELEKNSMNIIAGTIFDDLVSASNRENLIKQTHDICKFVTSLPKLPKDDEQKFKTPYLTFMDFFHPERSCKAGHPDTAHRLSNERYNGMLENIKLICTIAWDEYGVRPVLHPHAGGYIEFADEIRQIAKDISYEMVGFLFDTGHLYYAGMDPETWIREFIDRIDYIHFKDVNKKNYDEVMAQEIDFFDACAKGVMCPIGSGVIDYTGINRALREIKYNGWVTVEQERDPRDADTSLRDVTRSHEYLKSVGY